jgi:Na+/H+ antiporter NhaD/arsenite permease-like protein
MRGAWGLLLGLCLIVIPLAASAADSATAAADAHSHHAEHEHLGNRLPVYSMLPFALLLASIAVFPLVKPHWWEHNTSKAMVAAALGIPAGLYVAGFGEAGQHALEHAGMEYVSFLLLLGALFVVSGGIYIRGTLKGTPVVNTVILAIGTALASLVGTTGASMLLIRPLLRANEKRFKVAHIVVFFIFTVSNCGGLLTPLGDPPLFLGFLKGVPFEWTLRLTPQWLVVNGALLVVFFVWDTWAIRYEEGSMELEASMMHSPETFGIEGRRNFLLLAAIIGIIYSSGRGFGNEGRPWPWGVQEGLMFAVALVSFLWTPRAVYEKNRFGFGPIVEVAVLFAGIFVTMIPALQILNVNGDSLGVKEPWQFFWATGVLSSFLDNAPTYLTFAATACGIQNIPPDGQYLAAFLALPPETNAAAIVAAISCGAVFMGANTYIGNGPNFMVKAIAEEYNVRMPGFFGYMAYSVGVLVPILVVVTFMFFR